MKFSGFTIPSSSSSFFFRPCSVVYDVAFPPRESFFSSFHLWNKIDVIILFFLSYAIYIYIYFVEKQYLRIDIINFITRVFYDLFLYVS